MTFIVIFFGAFLFCLRNAPFWVFVLFSHSVPKQAKNEPSFPFPFPAFFNNFLFSLALVEPWDDLGAGLEGRQPQVGQRVSAAQQMHCWGEACAGWVPLCKSDRPACPRAGVVGCEEKDEHK